MGVTFEWDPRKATANRAKHGVPFEEAMTVVAAPLARVFDDPDHSTWERREIIVGDSIRRRLLVVCFVEQRDCIRIFSARNATRRERQDYEENTT